MKITQTVIILVAAALLVWAGCEREVTETIVITENNDCFECHGEDGLLLAAKGEWLASVHASGTNVDYTNRGGSDCTECHNHQGFLEFIETGEVNAPYDQVSAIHCFTCHSPHDRGDLSLRTVAAVTMADGSTFDHGAGNLCANCHRARISADDIGDDFYVSSSHWGPHHGPQGDLLNSTNGYEFAGESYSSTSHAGAIEGSCIGCHMGNPRTHVGYTLGGHSFNVTDEDGNSLVGVCGECHDAATGSGATIDFLADADYDGDGTTEGYQTELDGMAEDLAALLLTAGLVDSDHEPVKQTVADGNSVGALYNFLMYEEDRSRGIHNFNYIHDLLATSIAYMESIASPQNQPEIVLAH